MCVCGWSYAFRTFLTPLLLRDVTQLCGFAIETLCAPGQVCAMLQAQTLQLTFALSNMHMIVLD